MATTKEFLESVIALTNEAIGYLDEKDYDAAYARADDAQDDLEKALKQLEADVSDVLL